MSLSGIKLNNTHPFNTGITPILECVFKMFQLHHKEDHSIFITQ